MAAGEQRRVGTAGANDRANSIGPAFEWRMLNLHSALVHLTSVAYLGTDCILYRIRTWFWEEVLLLACHPDACKLVHGISP